MTTRKLPALPELTETAEDDVVHVVDVSNTADDATGSSRKVRLSNLVPASVFTAIKRTFSKQQNTAKADLTDGATVGWNLDDAQAAQVTLGGNRTLANPSNMVNGGTYSLLVRQDATGGRTLAFGPAYKFPGGAAPSLTAAANAVDLFVFYSDGTSMFGSALFNFA